MPEKQQANDAGNGDEPFKRWTGKRKAAVVLDLIKGKTTAAGIARPHDVTVGEVEKWLETFTQAGAEALRSNPRERDEQHEAERKNLQARIGAVLITGDLTGGSPPTNPVGHQGLFFYRLDSAAGDPALLPEALTAGPR